MLKRRGQAVLGSAAEPPPPSSLGPCKNTTNLRKPYILQVPFFAWPHVWYEFINVQCVQLWFLFDLISHEDSTLYTVAQIRDLAVKYRTDQVNYVFPKIYSECVQLSSRLPILHTQWNVSVKFGKDDGNIFPKTPTVQLSHFTGYLQVIQNEILSRIFKISWIYMLPENHNWYSNIGLGGGGGAPAPQQEKDSTNW
jgi:hypothetical protein